MPEVLFDLTDQESDDVTEAFAFLMQRARFVRDEPTLPGRESAGRMVEACRRSRSAMLAEICREYVRMKTEVCDD